MRNERPHPELPEITPGKPASQIAEELYGALYPEALECKGRAAEGEVFVDICRENTTLRLHVFGELEGEPAFQTLSRSKRGIWNFSTVFTNPGGRHIQYHLVPGSPADADPEAIAALSESLFARSIR